jgi:uncharacterized protein (DUF362 family)
MEEGELPTAAVGLTRRADRRETVAAALTTMADQVDLSQAQRVVVKPNFVTPYRQLAATHVDGVRAVLDFVRRRFDGPVVIAEGSATSPTWDGYRNYGYQALVDEYRVELRDLNADETVEITVYDGRMRPMRLRLARTVAEGDFRISICPPKTHDTVIVTLSIKNVVMGALVNPHANQDGNGKGSVLRAAQRLGRLLPDWAGRHRLAEWVKGNVLGRPGGSQKMAMHQGVPVININLALVAPVVWPHLSVIDGWVGMEGRGPNEGTPVNWGVALAGTDPLAVDSVTAHLMGFEPQGVGYLHYCQELDLGIADLSEIEVVGDLRPAEVARSFEPHPTIEQQRRWHLAGAERYLQREA